MATNRTEKLQHIHKLLKKHYGAPPPGPDRTLLEHLLYACCLENSRHEKTDEAFARLQSLFFDWNEIRVTTVAELSEAMGGLHNPPAAAQRLRRLLQSIFESHYSFDLEAYKKQNLGKACKELEKYAGVTAFGVAYANQHALGGHSIPLDQGVLEVLLVLGVIGQSEVQKTHVPGLERAIPKNKGVEFAYLLHQLGAEYLAAPFSNKVRSLLIDIDPQTRNRLPKRVAKSDDNGAQPSGPKSTTARKKRGPREGAEGADKAVKTPAKRKKRAEDDQARPAKRKKKSDSATSPKSAVKKKASTKQLTKKKPK